MKVFISGFGTVGQGVFEMLLLKLDLLDSMGGVKVVGIMDSKSYSVDNDKGICGLCAIGGKKLSGKVGKNDRNGMEGKDILDMADYDVLIECTKRHARLPTNVNNCNVSNPSVPRNTSALRKSVVVWLSETLRNSISSSKPMWTVQ